MTAPFRLCLKSQQAANGFDPLPAQNLGSGGDMLNFWCMTAADKQAPHSHSPGKVTEM